MKKKKKSSSNKGLRDDKWYFDTSNHQIKFGDSETISQSNHPLQHQLNSLNATLQRQTEYLSTIRKEEVEVLSGSKTLNKSAFNDLYQKAKKQKHQIAKIQKQIKSLEQQIQTFYSSEKKSTHPHTTFSTASSSLPIQSVYHTSINIGDYCYHKLYGNGIVLSKTDSSCRVLFSNELFKSLSYQDNIFKDNTFTVKNAWNQAHGKYTQPFPDNSSSIPSSLQDSYTTFIENQNKNLCSAISKLYLYTKNYANNYSSGFYAQLVLDTIYNIEHGPQVFLSLQNKIKASEVKLEKSTHPQKVPLAPPSPASTPPMPTLSIQFKPSTDTLYVYSGRIKCIRDKHNMVCANAHIATASGETAILNVNCCLNCNRFYISYDEYARYMEKYRSLLTRIVLVDENGNSSFANNLAVESTLKLCGYSVSQEKGFTSKERATLLAHIIHNGLVSKPDVIQHLNWLIRMNGKKAGNVIAKEKWEEDLAFVRNLDCSLQTNHVIHTVAPYPSKKHRK